MTSIAQDYPRRPHPLTTTKWVMITLVGLMRSEPFRAWARTLIVFLLAIGGFQMALYPDMFDAAEARNTVQVMLERRLEEASFQPSVSDLVGMAIGHEADQYKPVVYRLIQLDRRGSNYRAVMVSTLTGRTGSLYTTEFVQAALEEGRYSAALTERTGSYAVISNGRYLLLEEDGVCVGRLALSNPDIPIRQRAGFGPVVQNPWNPREIAICVLGDHPVLVMTIFPSVMTVSPVVRMIDPSPQGRIDRMIWLPIGDLLAVETTTNTGQAGVSLYNLAERQRPVKLDPPWITWWGRPSYVRLNFYSGQCNALVLSMQVPGRDEKNWAWRPETGQLQPWTSGI